MSFVREIVTALERRGGAPAIIETHGSSLVPSSGAQLLEQTLRARRFLRERGVIAGDRVALLAPNSARWAAIDLAIMAEGAIAVPLYARQAAPQLAAMMQDARPTVLIAADQAFGTAMRLAWREACPIVTFEEVLSLAPLPAAEPCAGAGPVTIIYTSGTSGEPKGVVLTHEGVDFMLDVTVRRVAEMTGSGRSEDRVFHYLPFCFAGSRIMLWSQLRRGNPLTISTNLDALQEELRAARPHYFLNVPVLLERIKNGVDQRMARSPLPLRALYTRALAGEALHLALANRLLFPRIKKLLGEDLEFLVCGSARLSEDTQRWFERLGLPVYQVYGLTETTGIVTIDDTKNVVPGRVGLAVPGCEVRLGDAGELLCRGPNVFAGYWNKPQATAEVLRDGWLHTGDQAEIDARGNVKIIGRLKDVIVPESGHNVAPAAIEEKLLAAGAGVEQALVVGHGRPYLTALVTGKVAPDAVEPLLQRVNAQLPHYQRLRKLHVAAEAWTPDNGLLTANQKLRRAAIEAHHRDAVEAMYR